MSSSQFLRGEDMFSRLKVDTFCWQKILTVSKVFLFGKVGKGKVKNSIVIGCHKSVGARFIEPTRKRVG